jgi:hypothetical protein
MLLHRWTLNVVLKIPKKRAMISEGIIALGWMKL